MARISCFLIFCISFTSSFSQGKITPENFWDGFAEISGNNKLVVKFIDSRIGFYIFDHLDQHEKELIRSSFIDGYYSIIIKFIIPVGKEGLIKISSDAPVKLQPTIKELLSNLDFTYFTKGFELLKPTSHQTILKFGIPKNNSEEPCVFFPETIEFNIDKLTYSGAKISKKKNIIHFNSTLDYWNYIAERTEKLIFKGQNLLLNTNANYPKNQQIYVHYAIDSLGKYSNISSSSYKHYLEKEADALFKRKKCRCIPPNYYGYHYNLEFIKHINISR